jgi:acetyltransferase-like isoleucine patch superfamily enzyme
MSKNTGKPMNIGHNGAHTKVIYDENFKCGKGSTYNDYFWCNARGGVTIGTNTLIGPNVTIVSTNHIIKNIGIEQNANDENSWCGGGSKRLEHKHVIIGDDVWIGAGCIVLAGSNIPDKCVIGAGVTITESNSKRLSRGDIVVMNAPLRVLGNRADND